MLFTTDQQTIEDLNIFGGQGKDSIFNLFNLTRTVNGTAVMEEMLRYPLADATAINMRCGLIGYLKAINASFPFDAVLFDSIAQYLANTDQRSKLSADKRGIGKKISGLIAIDNDFKVIQAGIRAFIEVVRQLHGFLNELLSPRNSPFGYDPETLEVSMLLTAGIFKSLLHEPVGGKLTYDGMVQYDRGLRFKDVSSVKKVLRYIARLDAYIAIAAVAAARGFVFPVALAGQDRTTLIERFYHPELKKAVPNSVQLSRDHNAIFLTGANMAGKSTFMKSLGIAMYLAHAGFPVAATHMEFSVMDGIYTTINLPDDLGMGASHFYAEVLRVKKVARELSQSKKLFVIFDEMFRGTNVKDAYEATIAITAAFAAKRDSVFVISTHIIEAGDVLKERCSGISFKYLPTYMKGAVPQYTYTLETGITADRHGMVIINNEGILDILRNGKIKTVVS